MHMDTVDYFFQYKHKDNNLCPQLIPYSYAWMLYVGLALIWEEFASSKSEEIGGKWAEITEMREW